jgi:hypothetical protein
MAPKGGVRTPLENCGVESSLQQQTGHDRTHWRRAGSSRMEYRQVCRVHSSSHRDCLAQQASDGQPRHCPSASQCHPRTHYVYPRASGPAGWRHTRLSPEATPLRRAGERHSPMARNRGGDRGCREGEALFFRDGCCWSLFWLLCGHPPPQPKPQTQTHHRRSLPLSFAPVVCFCFIVTRLSHHSLVAPTVGPVPFPLHLAAAPKVPLLLHELAPQHFLSLNLVAARVLFSMCSH